MLSLLGNVIKLRVYFNSSYECAISFHLYTLCLLLEKGDLQTELYLLKGLAFCCEQLPPYFLGRAGVGKKIGVLFPKTTNLMTLL